MHRACCLVAAISATAFIASARLACADVGNWYPRTIETEKGTAIIHAPQVDSWKDFETVSAWLAFQVSRVGATDSWYGSVRFTAQTDTDIQAREVLLHDFEITELEIDGLDPTSEEYALIADAFTSTSRTIPLDLVLAHLPGDIPLDASEDLNGDTPTIYYSDSPAILLFIDGEPRFLPIEETELVFVLNTPWDLLHDAESGALYLCHQGTWLTNTLLEGDWAWATTLPADFANLPDGRNWDRTRECLPEHLDQPTVPTSHPPRVFYTNEPAELLLTDGAATWTAIGDDGLSYADNSDQELFRVDEAYYVLYSGRWFTAAELDGPWVRARELPAEFQAIPAEDSEVPHEMSYVRSSIPGTAEAWEAALVASIPRKADIQRGSEDLLAIEVTYSGDPLFEPIEKTGIDMAINTSYQVLRYDGIYYLCHNATWLTSLGPGGPWQFADSIPDAFAMIPPSSPAYNTTFVSVDGSDEDSIEYAYTSGYEGAYVEDDTVVQGTGYDSNVAFSVSYYSGYPYPYYPYYWRPPTYGYGAWYNPNTGRYGEALVHYGPYGGAGTAAFHNPQTGVYGRGQGVWDSDEFRGRSVTHNPNTNTSIARNRYVDYENNSGWSERVARRGDEWVYSESQWQDGRMQTDFQTSRGTEGTVNRAREGDTIVSQGTVTGDERSAEVSSVLDDGTLTGKVEGSEGASGSYNRQYEDGEITGSGSISKDGMTIDSDVTRTAEGVQREFETSSGGQGVSQRSGDDSRFVYESGSGDVYAGRDGNVYQKTDDGWEQVQNPGNRGATANSQSMSTQGAPIWESREQGGYGNTQGGYAAGTPGSYDLNRDYQNRQRGYDSYQRNRAVTGPGQRSGGRFGGRRRR